MLKAGIKYKEKLPKGSKKEPKEVEVMEFHRRRARLSDGQVLHQDAFLKKYEVV